jgi:hypothetical protein
MPALSASSLSAAALYAQLAPLRPSSASETPTESHTARPLSCLLPYRASPQSLPTEPPHRATEHALGMPGCSTTRQETASLCGGLPKLTRSVSITTTHRLSITTTPAFYAQPRVPGNAWNVSVCVTWVHQRLSMRRLVSPPMNCTRDTCQRPPYMSAPARLAADQLLCQVSSLQTVYKSRTHKS